MPVLVTAADQPLARRIASRLLDEGGEVRVVAAGEVAALRATGAFVASATSDDEGRLEAAMAQVHTVVHVGGGLLTPDPDRIVRDAEVLARAATGAGIGRLIALSVPGAEHDAADDLRRAKAAAEAALSVVPCPTIVLRVGLVDTPALRDTIATAGLDPQVLDTEVAPTRPGDVADLVAAFDRARSRSTDGHLVVRGDGPWRTTLAGYLERVGVSRPGGGSLVGRRVPDPATVGRIGAALAGPWITEDPVVLDGWRFAGLTPGAPGVDTSGTRGR